MTPDSVGPLSRPFSVRHLPPNGAEVTIEATADECSALAQDLGLPALEGLVGRYRVTGTATHVRVRGRLEAALVQTCVVTLDDFSSRLDEAVELEFRAGPQLDPGAAAGSEHEVDLDAPDELVGDRIDLGAITAEFLALSLDPYPRKPGVDFEKEASDDAGDSPFSALASLRKLEP